MTVAKRTKLPGKPISPFDRLPGSLSEWDIGGRRSRLIYPGAGLFLDYDYNGINSLWRIRENGALSGPGVLASFEYDGFDRRNLLLRGNGRRTLYEYDRASRLSALVNTSFGSAADVRFEFTYNPASQIVTRWSSNDAYAWTGHFNENRTGTANGLNQLTQVRERCIFLISGQARALTLVIVR